MLRIYQVALDVARDAAVAARVIGLQDADLARQLRRAATSIPLNVADNNDPGRSLARIPNGNDKNNALTDWASTVNVTPGAANQP